MQTELKIYLNSHRLYKFNSEKEKSQDLLEKYYVESLIFLQILLIDLAYLNYLRIQRFKSAHIYITNLRKLMNKTYFITV